MPGKEKEELLLYTILLLQLYFYVCWWDGESHPTMWIRTRTHVEWHRKKSKKNYQSFLGRRFSWMNEWMKGRSMSEEGLFRIRTFIGKTRKTKCSFFQLFGNCKHNGFIDWLISVWSALFLHVEMVFETLWMFYWKVLLRCHCTAHISTLQSHHIRS